MGFVDRLGYLVLFVGLAVPAHDAYKLCKRCNISSMMLRMNGPSGSDYYVGQYDPMAPGVSYLPEEDYVDKLAKERAEQQPLDRDNRNLLPEYRNLCEVVTRKVRLDDTEYEYQPPHYHETYCKSYFLLDSSQHPANPSKQKCVHPGFHCVQRSRALSLVRRQWDSECWEPFVQQIASGCDCMWPVSNLGEITPHYEFPHRWDNGGRGANG